MKKIVIIILTFFSLLNISYATTIDKADIYALFKMNGEYVKEIKIEKNENFKIILSINKNKKFDIYAVLGELEYDKKALKLVNIKGLNDFTITTGKNILADRIEINEVDELEVLELEFKVLESKKTKISFSDIKVADDLEEIELGNISINCIPKNNNILLFGILGLSIISVGSAIIFKLRKSKIKIKR